tara:strand:- start:364 stop:1083 length:720 start_codon:yes stop_codon:yes gene_type:complete
MGTRHLTIVKQKGEVKVAQYGQWDGYPDGVGTDIVNFLHEIKSPEMMERFRRRVALCRWATQEEIDSINEAMEMTELEAPMNQLYPEFSRDTSARLLWLIMNGKKNYLLPNNQQPRLGATQFNLAAATVAEEESKEATLLNNSIDFGNDRMFCEWAWVIDLDEDKLECYCGYRTCDGPKGIFEEFDNPVRLQASFDLPIKEDYGEFIARCEPREPTEEEEAKWNEELMLKIAERNSTEQ